MCVVFSCNFIPQVISELRALPIMDLGADSGFLDELRAHFGKDIDGFVSAVAGQTMPSSSVKAPQRMPNQHFGHALDHALAVSLGVSLEAFKAEQQPKPLLQTEVRYVLCAWEGGAGRGAGG